MGADSRFHCRAQRFPHPSAVRALSFPAWSRIRRRRAFCLRNRACIRQDQSQPKRPALRIPEKHHATRSRPGWFAMDRLWQSRCQRSCTNDRYSNNADCDHVCPPVPDRTGGGSILRIPQHNGFARYDGDFHCPNTLRNQLIYQKRRIQIMTQVEAIAKYAARASFEDLSAESRRQLPIHILDSLACCIAALGAGPVDACRAQVAEFGGSGPSALIGGWQARPIFATFWHSVLVRYLDFMDNILAQTETAHTADNFGVALTIADYVGGSGRDLMLAVALGYTVQSRLVDHADFMTRGLDHTSQLAFSHNAAAGRLLGLSDQQIGHAIAMAAVSDASFAVVRAKPLSQWKGLASAQSALGAMNALFLARRGVEGPLQVIEGPLGIDHLLGMKINIDWDKQRYEGVVGSTIKKYNSMIHTQSAVHCMVELAKANKVDPAKVTSIEAEVFQLAYDFAGGGLYSVDKVIRTKEQADHSLPYLLAVALIDGDVMPAQFNPERIIKPDVQGLLKKVSVRPNREFTEVYPEKMPAKVTVRLQDGTTIENEVQDYPGLASRPFTWDQSVEKFDSLVGGRIDQGICREIKAAVRSLETIQARELTSLLGRLS